MDIIHLVKNPAKCDELLSALDAIARTVDRFEYGLPLYDEAQKSRMREAIYIWACSKPRCDDR